MRRITEVDHNKLMEYIMIEPEYNTYLFGDIEMYGFRNESLSLFTDCRDDNFNFILMKYFDNYVLYSHSGKFDSRRISDFLLKNSDCGCISGKGKIIQLLIPFLPIKRIRKTIMCSLTESPSINKKLGSFEICRLRESEVSKILELYLSIDEFRSKYGNESSEIDKKRIVRAFQTGRFYGVSEGGKLISLACSTAESKICAMITDVATREDYRGLGLASYIVTKLCNDLFDEGRHFLCLYYDNLIAGKMYERIGFKQVGDYSIIRW